MTSEQGSATAQRTMHIGELADQTGLSLRTIRHYDETGLLPASTRTDGGFRVYTDADLARLLVIRSMKPLGFSLEQMAELLDAVDRLDGGSEEPSDRRQLASYISQAEDKRDKLARNLKQADQFIRELKTK
ncbi:MerR family transcriptional regulator [Arthrobacter sp. H5]|uniref:MerR family transcriptional regulator n=1 Tax=Arthrobacter sp. H5 TaxID=1267973 RepID=UPI00048876F3|nr:MerR family transcriptional regulator [Arthrobacter sp. H5]